MDNVLRRTKTKLGEHGLCSPEIVTWNSLLSDLHNITYIYIMRKQLKSALIDSDGRIWQFVETMDMM